MKDLISIIVPIYNVEKYLERCLNTLINQTYANIEIILVNDGSTDNSVEICKKYSNLDKRIRLINQKNQGASCARNTGIESSKGEYITFVDADDWVETDFVQKMYEQINDCDVVRCQYFINNKQEQTAINEGIIENEVYYNKEIKQKIIYEFLTGKKMCYLYLLLIKKESLKNVNSFNKDLFVMEDTCFYLDLLSNIKKIKFIPNSLYHHYYNSESLVQSPKNIKRNMFNILVVNNYMRKIAIKNNLDCLETIDIMDFGIIINHILKFYKNHFKIKELREILKEISNKTDFRELLNRINKSKLNKQYKIAFFLIKRKMYTLLLITWKIIYKMKG